MRCRRSSEPSEVQFYIQDRLKAVYIRFIKEWKWGEILISLYSDWRFIYRHFILLLIEPSDLSLPLPLPLDRSLWLKALWISFVLRLGQVSSYFPPLKVRNLPDRRAMSFSTAWAISSCLFLGVVLALLTWKSIIARSWIFPWWFPFPPINTSWVLGWIVILCRLYLYLEYLEFWKLAWLIYDFVMSKKCLNAGLLVFLISRKNHEFLTNV